MPNAPDGTPSEQPREERNNVESGDATPLSPPLTNTPPASTVPLTPFPATPGAQTSTRGVQGNHDNGEGFSRAWGSVPYGSPNPNSGNTTGWSSGIPTYSSYATPGSHFPISPMHPGIRRYARITTILYAARIRPSEAPPFARELALTYPFLQALAVDLSRHTSSRSRRRRRHLTFRRVNVFTVGRFMACAGAFLVFLRLWLILSLVFSEVLATLFSMEEVHSLVSYLVSELINSPHERFIYNALRDVFQQDNHFRPLQLPVSIANVSVNPFLFTAALFATPFVSGAICFIIGAFIAVVCNGFLALVGGIRLENHED